MRFIAAIDTRFYGVAYSQGSEVNTVDWSRKQMLQFLDKGLIQASQITAGAIQDAIVFEGADVTTTVDASGRLVVHIETEAKELDWLTDVDTTGKVDDSVLAYDEGTGTWRPISLDLSGATVAFANLSDVDVSAAVNGSTIEFDALTGTWVAGPPLSSGTLAGLSDVDVTGIVDGQTVVWDNSEAKFVPGTPTGTAGPPGPVTWLAPVPWTSGLVATTGPPATVVTYNGSAYVCILSHTNVVPTNGTYWRLIVSKGDPGAQGDPGSPGSPGAAGPGVPTGGTTGQALKKSSNADYATTWATLHEVPAGGATGKVLKKNSATDYDLVWGDASAVAALDDLTDVDAVTGRITGSALVWNGTLWVPGHQVPAGGATGQVLKKASGTDFDMNWADDSTGTSGNVYRGNWDAAVTYAIGDLVNSDAALWYANAASTGVIPVDITTPSQTGSDGGPGSYSVSSLFNASQIAHPFRLTTNATVGGVRITMANANPPPGYVEVAFVAAKPTGTTVTFMNAVTGAVPAPAGSNRYDLYLDATIDLLANTDYWVYLRAPGTSTWGDMSGHLTGNYTYSGICQAAVSTTGSTYRQDGGTWADAAGSRHIYIGILTVAAQSWTRVGTNKRPVPDSETFSYGGPLGAPYVGGHRLYNDSGKTRTITKARVSVGTAPAGSSVVVDININGTTAFTAKPTIAAGALTTLAYPSTAAWPAGSYLTVDIDAIGSTTPGSDLTVTVSWTE